MTSPQGLLVVIAGPSGVGKGTVVRRLLDEVPDAKLSVSATTRAPRPGEIDGVHYHFVDDVAFDRLVAEGALLEWAEYAGHRYGTPRSAADDAVAAGEVVLLEIEVAGAAQIRRRRPEALSIFLAPPSLEELERRLVARGTEDPERRRRRLAVARAELAEQDRFDHVVVNGDLDRCVAAVRELIETARDSPEPMG